MVKWDLRFTKEAGKDAQLLKAKHLERKAQKIIETLKEDPYGKPPPYEKLKADLYGKYSRRINIKHRIVYSVNPDDSTIIIYTMFSHYGD